MSLFELKEKKTKYMILNVQVFTLDDKYRFSKTGTLLKYMETRSFQYSFSNAETIE